jgi:hypothetical protein
LKAVNVAVSFTQHLSAVKGIKTYSFNVLNRPKIKKAAFYSEAASLCSYQAETFAAVAILDCPSIIFKGKVGLPGTRKQFVEISVPGEVCSYLRIRSVQGPFRYCIIIWYSK